MSLDRQVDELLSSGCAHLPGVLFRSDCPNCLRAALEVARTAAIEECARAIERAGKAMEELLDATDIKPVQLWVATASFAALVRKLAKEGG